VVFDEGKRWVKSRAKLDYEKAGQLWEVLD
jgi:hypothetical protein